MQRNSSVEISYPFPVIFPAFQTSRNILEKKIYSCKEVEIMKYLKRKSIFQSLLHYWIFLLPTITVFQWNGSDRNIGSKYWKRERVFEEKSSNFSLLFQFPMFLTRTYSSAKPLTIIFIPQRLEIAKKFKRRNILSIPNKIFRKEKHLLSKEKFAGEE